MEIKQPLSNDTHMRVFLQLVVRISYQKQVTFATVAGKSRNQLPERTHTQLIFGKNGDLDTRVIAGVGA